MFGSYQHIFEYNLQYMIVIILSGFLVHFCNASMVRVMTMHDLEKFFEQLYWQQNLVVRNCFRVSKTFPYVNLLLGFDSRYVLLVMLISVITSLFVFIGGISFEFGSQISEDIVFVLLKSNSGIVAEMII